MSQRTGVRLPAPPLSNTARRAGGPLQHHQVRLRFPSDIPESRFRVGHWLRGATHRGAPALEAPGQRVPPRCPGRVRGQPLLRLRWRCQRLCQGGVRGRPDRWDRRLVRRHRVVQASAWHPDTAHRPDPTEQGRDRPRLGRVRPAELPRPDQSPQLAVRLRHRRAGGHVGRGAGTQRTDGSVAPIQAAATAAESFDDETVSAVVTQASLDWIRQTPVTPLISLVVDAWLKGGHTQESIEAVLRGMGVVLDDNLPYFKSSFDRSAPWWMPQWAGDLVFERIIASFADPHRGCRVGPKPSGARRYRADAEPGCRRPAQFGRPLGSDRGIEAAAARLPGVVGGDRVAVAGAAGGPGQGRGLSPAPSWRRRWPS